VSYCFASPTDGSSSPATATHGIPTRGIVTATRLGEWTKAGVVAVCALVGLVGCKSRGEQNSNDGRRVTKENLESVGKEVGLFFPAGTRLVGVHRERGADDLIAVKVEMPAGEWPGFVAQTPIDPALFRPGERGLLGPDDGFWDPHKAKNLRTAEAALSGARVLNLGYDDSRGSMVAVFVVNHSI
jgi:hypothetical protein